MSNSPSYHRTRCSNSPSGPLSFHSFTSDLGIDELVHLRIHPPIHGVDGLVGQFLLSDEATAEIQREALHLGRQLFVGHLPTPVADQASVVQLLDTILENGLDPQPFLGLDVGVIPRPFAEQLGHRRPARQAGVGNHTVDQVARPWEAWRTIEFDGLMLTDMVRWYAHDTSVGANTRASRRQRCSAELNWPVAWKSDKLDRSSSPRSSARCIRSKSSRRPLISMIAAARCCLLSLAMYGPPERVFRPS